MEKARAAGSSHSWLSLRLFSVLASRLQLCSSRDGVSATSAGQHYTSGAPGGNPQGHRQPEARPIKAQPQNDRIDTVRLALAIQKSVHKICSLAGVHEKSPQLRNIRVLAEREHRPPVLGTLAAAAARQISPELVQS
eukprot:Amastigsp_a5493_25.p3 type:complete len:137 gc:universal Amastigsp_a5493_25:1107-1517(+)